MATLTSVTKHFPTPKEGFITTLSSTISSGATTVPLTSVAGLNNGDVFVGLIEPGLANEQAFTGTVDTAGLQITGVVWTKGTNVGHTAGVTIVDYVTSTHIGMMTKGIVRDHNQSGYHKTLNDDNGNEWVKQISVASAVNEVSIANAITGTAPYLSATGGDTNIDLGLYPKGSGQLVVNGRYDGWSVGALPAVSSVTANGNRSYDITFASTVASTLSSGMRLRTTRTVAAPTQCTSLNGTTQYYSKASPNKLTFTDDFVVSAWVKLSSYAIGSIASRYNGTSGWNFRVNASGQVELFGINAGAANYRGVQTYQSIPLNKWVHITAQIDMSTHTATTTTDYVMLDGRDVPATPIQGGTNPTALIQAGDLNIGAANATNFFPGKIAQVAIFNAKVTQATAITYYSQGLSGSETSLASAYSFNNAITDLNTTTPNDLTANGSAVATNADSPFGNAGASTTLDYALVMSVSGSTATVQVPEGCTIPTSGGVTSVAYSVQGNPYGWVSDKGRWEVLYTDRTASTQSSPTNGTWYNLGSKRIDVPVGAWEVEYAATIYTSRGASSGTLNPRITLSTSSSSESDADFTSDLLIVAAQSGVSLEILGTLSRKKRISVSATTSYYLNAGVFVTGHTTLQIMAADRGPTRVTALPNGL